MKPLKLTDRSRNNELNIVIPEESNEHERAAAAELHHYLKRISGADAGTVGTKIAVVQEHSGLTGNTVYVGRTEVADSLGIGTPETPEAESFVIKRVDNGIVIKGADGMGTRFGAYHFLETLCGVRWFWPGVLGEDIPENIGLAVGDIDISEKPDFRTRSMGKLHTTLWGMRNKLGGSLEMVGTHSFGQMVPPDEHGPSHPEYFALVNGKRTWENFNGKHGCQLCTTNSEVINLSIKYVRNFFDTHPEHIIYNISPNDGGGFCECPKCMDLTHGQKISHRGQEGTCASGPIFTFANQIGDAVAETHPGHMIGILAYHAYIDIPKIENFKLNDNVVLELCLQCDLDHIDSWKDQTVSLLEDWSGKARRKAIYEYYIWRGNANLPRELYSVIPDSIRRYHANGAVIFRTQASSDFTCSGLDYYLASKLLWDVRTDTDALLEDYMTRAFGAAALPMKRYHQLLDDRWKDASRKLGPDFYTGSPVYHLEMFSQKVMTEIDSLLTEAEKLADSYKAGARIERFRSLNRYAVLTLDALGSLQDLQKNRLCYLDPRYPTRIADKPFDTQSVFAGEWEESGKESKTKGAGQPAGDSRKAAELVDSSLSAWNRRDAYIRELKDADIIDYWHIRNNVDRDYGFDPRDKLKSLKESLNG